jgi:predicted phage terminase large subunit-like protein
MTNLEPAAYPSLEQLLDLIGPVRLRRCPFRPTPRQEAFLRLLDPEVFYGGAAGGGKSVALVMAAAQYVDVPGYHALLLRPTLPELRRPGGLIDLSHQWFASSQAEWNEERLVWRFPGPGRSGASGSSISFGYCGGQADVGRYAGASYSFLGFDELPQIDELTYHRMRRVLRQPANQSNVGRSPDGLTLADVPVRIRATGNPGGPHHDWVKRYFVDPVTRGAGVLYVASRLRDNPHIDLAGYADQLAHLPAAERERMLNGDWDIPDDGSTFQRHWFEIIDPAAVPEVERAVRYWDLAASTPTPGNPDPDYTVGLRLDVDKHGIYYIRGIIRRRHTAGKIVQLLKAAAELDGYGVKIVVEHEPGSASDYVERHLKRDLLLGYAISMDRATGSKETRAYSVAADAEEGKVRLVAGPHCDEFLDELAQFPNGRHDDCVDALSGAHRALGPSRRVHFGSGVPRGSIDEYGEEGFGRIWSFE